MSEQKKNKANIIVAVLFIFGLMFWCFVKSPDEISVGERRKLKQFPELSAEGIFGKGQSTFMNEFESYAADQFPMREQFRKANTFISMNVLGKKEVNEIFVEGQYISKLDYELHEDSIDWSLNRFEYICDKYLQDQKTYMAMIPDKSYYFQEKSSYPRLDFDELARRVSEGIDRSVEVIDLSQILSLENYYYSDIHWKQETLIPAAFHILMSMDAVPDSYDLNRYKEQFQVNTWDQPFYGVYAGQSALMSMPDTLKYLSGGLTDQLEVHCYDTGDAESMNVYDFEKAKGLDPYEIYLSGSKALITIENPNTAAEKNLVMFRDSFGSSIAPLLAGGYQKITLVDIRYISPAVLGKFVDFENADVLFLYSGQVLNHSMGQFIK